MVQNQVVFRQETQQKEYMSLRFYAVIFIDYGNLPTYVYRFLLSSADVAE